MANLNDITINISMNTKPLSTKGFGLPLILGSRTTGSEDEALIELYGEYSSTEELTAAGFKVTDAEYKIASLMFGQSPSPAAIAVYCRDDEKSISAALAELVETHNDWYALLITERDKESLHEAGDFAFGCEKIFFGCTDDVSALDDRNNEREAYLIHDQANKYPEAAWVGQNLPKPIGSITWKFQTPSGVTAANFSTTVLNEIRRKNGQTFTMQSGVIYSNEGITTGGEFIDNIMARDYVKARLCESLFSLKINNNKVSYDIEGLGEIEATMMAVFDMCGDERIIAKVDPNSKEDASKSDKGKYMYKISIPARSEVSSVDRSKRHLPRVKFSFTVAGAIHSLDVNGTIEV